MTEDSESSGKTENDTKVHLSIVEVESEDNADVTLSGKVNHVADLREAVNEETLLQTTFRKWNDKIETIDVDVESHRGFAGFDG